MPHELRLVHLGLLALPGRPELGQRDDEGPDGLAVRLVGDPDDGGLGDARVPGEDLLDLGRVDVEARDDDEVLVTVDDRERAVVAHDGHVAGVQPSGRVEHDLGGLQVLEVPREDVRAAHQHLAGITRLHVVAVGVDDAHLDAGQRHADRGGVVRLGRVGERHRRRGLGQPVALPQRDAEAGLEAVGDVRGERRRARDGQADRAQLVAGGRRTVGEGGERRRDRREDRDALGLGEGEHLGRVEALDEHGEPAHEELHAQHRVQAEDVERRQQQQHDVVRRRGGPDPQLHLLDVGEQAAVGEHGRLREAGGAGGEQQGGRVVDVAVDDAVMGVVLGRFVRAGAGRLEIVHVDDGVAEVGESRADLAVRPPCEHQARLDRLELLLELGGRALGVDGHRHRPEADHGEVGDDELRAGRDHQGDAVARLHPAAEQRTPRGPDGGAKVAVGDPAVALDEREPRRRGAG